MRGEFKSTSNYLAQFARQQPDAPAVIQRGATSSYSQFAGLVAKLARALRAFEIAPDTIVGIECDDQCVHLGLILACELIGVRSLSLIGRELRPDDRFAQLCGFILTENAPEIVTARGGHVLTAEWLAKIESTPVRAEDLARLDVPLDPHRFTRIVRTSGTTGAPKIMQLTGANIQSHIAQFNYQHPPHPVHFILLYGLTMQVACFRSFMTLKMGGKIIFSSHPDFFNDVRNHAANYSVMLPGDAERLIAALPASFRKPETFLLSTSGAGLPSRLRDQILQSLASRVVHIYASNETGGIGIVDEHGVGTLFDGVEVQIIDDDGKPVALGQPGRIRLKAAAAITAYMDDPALTAASFINGWFQTSDVGLVPAPRQLKILGRVDEMLNIGGHKVPPGPIEDKLKAVPGVRDAVAVRIGGQMESGLLGVAVETVPDIDVDAVLARLRDAIGNYVHNCEYVVTETLPRTENGKVIRRDVEAYFRKRLGIAG